jgi:hypothetical protein
MVRFVSCEETLALLVALIAGAIALKVFRASLSTSALIGLMAAVVVVYITFSEFTLDDDTIRFRSRFTAAEFPLSHVEKVGMQTFWAGLPGHIFVFILRKPPAQINGYLPRTGLSSWPSASAWLDAVNAAIKDKQK